MTLASLHEIEEADLSYSLPLRRQMAVQLDKNASMAFATEGKQSEEMRLMLEQAEQVIRAQEERIRQLENMALTDELTGLLNRRGLMQALRRELIATERDAEAHGLVVMVDLDGFKKINDTYGHAVGDKYLKAVAEALMKEVRATDIVARLGGDEFAVLLTRVGPLNALTRFNALERAFNEAKMIDKELVLPLRASFGFAPFSRGDQLEDLMVTADTRLYAHKALRRA